MSRTLRKQTGYRWWREAPRSNNNFDAEWERYCSKEGWSWFISVNRGPKSWDDIQAEMEENIILYERKEGDNSRVRSREGLKWHSKRFIRQAARRELSKVKKDPDYEYNQQADTLVKKLIWVYD